MTKFSDDDRNGMSHKDENINDLDLDRKKLLIHVIGIYLQSIWTCFEEAIH